MRILLRQYIKLIVPGALLVLLAVAMACALPAPPRKTPRRQPLPNRRLPLRQPQSRNNLPKPPPQRRNSRRHRPLPLSRLPPLPLPK